MLSTERTEAFLNTYILSTLSFSVRSNVGTDLQILLHLDAFIIKKEEENLNSKEDVHCDKIWRLQEHFVHALYSRQNCITFLQKV